VIRNARCATASDTFVADIGIRNGTIVQLGLGIDAGRQEIDAAGRTVTPGGVDGHCHLDQPMEAPVRMADDFESGTRSAACGGTTTVIPFAAQARGQSLRDAVADYHRRAEGRASVDYAFHLIVSDPTDAVLHDELPELIRSGYSSFKLYMTYDDLKLNDGQILDLLASLPDDTPGQRWADVVRLMSELGLRPVELLHLSVRTDPKTGERYWWCSYEKRAGGGITKPRRLFPLPLVDADGAAQQWHLLERWPIELPSLRSGNGAADAIATYLNRRTGWKALRAQLEAQSQRLSCYSFRHSYSVRGHQRGIDNGSMALAMGHSIEVHCRSYPWATEAGAAAAFKRAAVP
jgi:integrase